MRSGITVSSTVSRACPLVPAKCSSLATAAASHPAAQHQIRVTAAAVAQACGCGMLARCACPRRASTALGSVKAVNPDISQLHPQGSAQPAADRAAMLKAVNSMAPTLKQNMDRYHPKAVNAVLCSLAAIGHSPPGLLKLFLGHVEGKMNKFEVLELASCVSAAMSLGAAPSQDCLQAVLDKTFKGMKFADARTLGNTANILGSAKKVPAVFGLPSAALSALRLEAGPYIPRVVDPNAPPELRSDGSLRPPPRPMKEAVERPTTSWMARYCALSLSKMSDMDFKGLADSAYLLVKMEIANILMDRDAQILQQFNGTDLAVLANALAMYGYCPDAPFTTKFFAFLAAHISELSPRQAANLLCAFGDIPDMDPDLDLLDELLAMSEPVLPALPAKRISDLAQALSKLGHEPDPMWADTFRTAATVALLDVASAKSVSKAKAVDALVSLANLAVSLTPVAIEEDGAADGGGEGQGGGAMSEGEMLCLLLSSPEPEWADAYVARVKARVIALGGVTASQEAALQDALYPFLSDPDSPPALPRKVLTPEEMDAEFAAANPQSAAQQEFDSWDGANGRGDSSRSRYESPSSSSSQRDPSRPSVGLRGGWSRAVASAGTVAAADGAMQAVMRTVAGTGRWWRGGLEGGGSVMSRFVKKQSGDRGAGDGGGGYQRDDREGDRRDDRRDDRGDEGRQQQQQQRNDGGSSRGGGYQGGRQQEGGGGGRWDQDPGSRQREQQDDSSSRWDNEYPSWANTNSSPNQDNAFASSGSQEWDRQDRKDNSRGNGQDWQQQQQGSSSWDNDQNPDNGSGDPDVAWNDDADSGDWADGGDQDPPESSSSTRYTPPGRGAK
ncbi:MAG: hypothetical protein WDW38_011489 [Sanguina aurantia]